MKGYFKVQAEMGVFKDLPDYFGYNSFNDDSIVLYIITVNSSVHPPSACPVLC